MDKARITALLEALCERPLTDGQAEPADLRAFCREAAEALSQSAADDGERPSSFGVDRLTAALAVVLSGGDSEDARRTVEDAVLRSSSARLDAQSSIAFLDTIEQSPQAAPAALVEEMLAADRTAAARDPTRSAAQGSRLWARLAGTSWSARQWRLAAACVVLVAVGAASWTAFLQQANPLGGPEPLANAAHAPPALTDEPMPAPASSSPPTLARMQPCAPRIGAAHAGASGTAVRVEQMAPAATAGGDACGPDHQAADRSRTFAEPALNPPAAASAAPPAGMVIRPAAPAGIR